MRVTRSFILFCYYFADGMIFRIDAETEEKERTRRARFHTAAPYADSVPHASAGAGDDAGAGGLAFLNISPRFTHTRLSARPRRAASRGNDTRLAWYRAAALTLSD